MNIVEAAAIAYGPDWSELDRAKARQKLRAEREIEVLAIRTYTCEIATLALRLRRAERRLAVLTSQLGE